VKDLRSARGRTHGSLPGLVMGVGMFVAGAILTFVVGLKSWDEVTIQYPNQALLAMVAGMSIPMVAWMLFRGYGVEELLRDGLGHGPPGDPIPVPRMVRHHQECVVRAVLRLDVRGDVRGSCDTTGASTPCRCSGGREAGRDRGATPRSLLGPQKA
jgi:hypothetical protein